MMLKLLDEMQWNRTERAWDCYFRINA